jgi:hypothetical protein
MAVSAAGAAKADSEARVSRSEFERLVRDTLHHREVRTVAPDMVTCQAHLQCMTGLSCTQTLSGWCVSYCGTATCALPPATA